LSLGGSRRQNLLVGTVIADGVEILFDEEVEEENELGSCTKGKQGELLVIGELLRRQFEIFTPLVDSGIDCLVKSGDGDYKEIQIKYRENKPIFRVKNLKPSESFFVICYLKGKYGDDIWIIPSKIFNEKGYPVKGKGNNCRQLIIGKEGSETYESLRGYNKNYNQLLKGAAPEIKNAVQRASKRIAGQHFKQSDFEPEILKMLSKEPQPISRKQIVANLHKTLQEGFSKADLEAVGSHGRERWEVTARWAITRLTKKGLIEAKIKNHWIITSAGRKATFQGIS